MGMRVYYGWKLLAALGLIYFLSIGTVFYGLSVTLPEFVSSLGWSRSEASAGFSIMTLAMGLSGPLVAYSIGRFGVRPAMVVGGVVAAFGAVNMYFTNDLWRYYILVAPFLGVGVAMLSILPGTQLISNWFARRRALAIGLFMASGGLGRALVVPLFALVIDATGSWRLVWLIMAGSTLLCSLLAAWVVRERPEDMGLAVDGTRRVAEADADPKTMGPERKVFRSDRDWPAREALRTPAFWMLIAGSATAVVGGALVNSQALLHLQDQGLDVVLAATALGVVGFVSMGGRLVSGALGDHIEPRILLAFGLVLIGVGLVILNYTNSAFLAYVFAVVFGLGNGLALVTTPAILANFFGSGHYASIAAVRGIVTTLLSAAVPIGAGWFYDRFDTYGAFFWGYTGIAALAILSVAMLRPPGGAQRPTSRAGAGAEAAGSAMATTMNPPRTR